MRTCSKYHAVATTVDNIRFASKMEAHRYDQLKLLQKAGKISSLELQPEYPIVINGHLVCTYVADFRYFDEDTQMNIIEDVKGIATPLYKLKKKLVKAQLGLTITEITK